jgi:hypothetical protein
VRERSAVVESLSSLSLGEEEEEEADGLSRMRKAKENTVLPLLSFS